MREAHRLDGLREEYAHAKAAQIHHLEQTNTKLKEKLELRVKQTNDQEHSFNQRVFELQEEIQQQRGTY